MTVIEYLEQAQTLSHRIERDIEDLNQMREMMSGVTSPKYGGRVKSSQSTNASFVIGVERADKQEQYISTEVDLLVRLKSQIKEVIDGIPAEGAREVLTEKYILGHSWGEIKKKLNVSSGTIWRWHRDGINAAVLPDDAIKI